MKLRDINLQVNEKKLFLTSSFMHFAFISSEHSRLLFPKRLWKWASTISFKKYKWKVVLLVIYLPLYYCKKRRILNVKNRTSNANQIYNFCSTFSRLWCFICDSLTSNAIFNIKKIDLHRKPIFFMLNMAFDVLFLTFRILPFLQ